MSVIGVQTPRVECIPFSETLEAAEETIELCASYGLHLDDWQKHYLRGSLGETQRKWTATRAGLSLARQSGKTKLFEARELAGLILFEEELIVHSAHLVPTALEAFRRMKVYFENYDDLRKRVHKIREANGEQAIELLSGQRLRFMARAKGQGRGFSPDALMLDEAQELSEDTWSDILPSLSARPNSQAWLFGTPPSEVNNGEVFATLREAGLSGKDARLCWMEWSADPDITDFDDVSAWAQANPALGIRVPLSAIEDERNSMSEIKFGRERLGIWGSEGSARVIPAQEWENAGKHAPRPPDPVLALAVDMSPDRQTTSLASSTTVGGVPLVDVHETRQGAPDWVVPRVVAACKSKPVRAVVIDGAGPASSLIEPLRAQKIEVTVTGAGHMKRACGMFYDAVLSGNIRHLNHAGLNVAASAVRKRKLEDAFAWQRKDPDADITPIVAVTLALYGLLAQDVKKPRRKSGGATFV